MSTKTISKAEISKSNLSDEGEVPKGNSSKLTKVTSLNPKIKELMKDKIFQYYFVIYYNSKEYSEFRNLPDQEKLSFMLNLYFFIMKDVTKDSLFDLKTVTTEEQMNNVNGELMDRLLMLKDDIAKRRIINTINVFNINNITEQGSIRTKFQSILDKYKMDDCSVDKLASNNNWSNMANNTLNVNITNSNTIKYRDRDDPQMIENNISSSFYKNSIMKQKQKYLQETTQIPIYSMPLLINNNNHNNNNDNSNQISILSIMPSCISLKKLSQSKKNSFVKINYNQVSLENLGPIEKGNYYIKSDITKEIDFTSEKHVYISNPNGIQEENSSHYIICNSKKLKHPNNNSEFTTHLNYKTLINPHQVSNIRNHNSHAKGIGKSKGKIHQSNGGRSSRSYMGRNQNEKVIYDIVLLNQSISDTKLNLVLAKGNSLSDDMNEIITKLYSDSGNANTINTFITFNSNEANKIGILLIELIRLEKKYNELMVIKNQLKKKYERNTLGLSKYRTTIENKFNETRQFLQANVA